MKPLELAWVKYRQGNQLTHCLILYLGEENIYTYGFLANKIPDREITAIRVNLTTLAVMNFPSLVQWSKAHLPVAYRQGFRRMITKQLEVEKTFPIKELKQQS